MTRTPPAARVHLARAMPQLAATTRALRLALALPAALLALSGSGAAFAAGTCTTTIPGVVACNGDFAHPVEDDIPPGDFLPDLTLVLGADAPTTVTPADFDAGLSSTWGGEATVISYADIDTVGADAIYMYSSGSTTLASHGALTTEVSAGGAHAIDIAAVGQVDIGLYGDVFAYSDALFGGVAVLAIDAHSFGGDIDLRLDADASVDAHAHSSDAGAIVAFASGDVDLTLDGDVSAVSDYSQALAVNAYAYFGDASLDNDGELVAEAYFRAEALVLRTVFGDASLYNGGEIRATSVDFDASAVVVSGYGDVDFDNVGDVLAEAGSPYGDASAVVAYARYGDIDFHNSGHIVADGADVAHALQASAFHGRILIDNGGQILADATRYGSTSVRGLMLAGTYVDIVNGGSLSASSRATANYSGADAVTIEMSAGEASLDNAGSIYAYASGSTANAIAASLFANSLYVYNDGDIAAVAVGADSNAYGFDGGAAAGVTVINQASIRAEAEDRATAISLDSSSYVHVFNHGSIAAYGDGLVWAINSSGGLSDDAVYNYDTIIGALSLGYGDDRLYNEGDWTPGQTASYFWAGDDAIVNAGSIHLVDSVIDLGLYSADGNEFHNTAAGTITVEGDNEIDMGGPQAVIPALNPLAFYNDGVIDFQDGAADDSLLIVGDFAGDGHIAVDASGLDAAADVLTIDGSVVSGTVQAIDVDLLDLPPDLGTLVPVVYVTGVSASGNFVPGSVDWDSVNTFVALDFSISADIDASNATPDVFSLGIEVSGLSDPGALAASIPGSVQGLMNTQVGTWRQRAGVMESWSKGGVSLWARVFQDKGSFSPEHSANFGPGGNFDWHQKNSGVEAGIDFAVTDEFSLGLLVAQAQADTHLESPGAASADLDADTWGIYGTWISPNGFYLDASYRWMSFDVDLTSVAGPMAAEGDAESFNIEIGYAWTLSGGLKIEPQLQYTNTHVDNIDVLETSTGMAFRNDGGDSSRGRIGVALRKSFGEADAGWLWSPHVALSAVREFDGENSYAINDNFFGRVSNEGTSALLELGFTARHQNWAITGGLNWQDGGAINSFFGGQLGLRYTFGAARD